MKLPQFSVALKLYAIFALLTTITVGLATVALVNAHRHEALTDRFEAALSAGRTVERIDGLISAVTTQARSLFRAQNRQQAAAYAKNLVGLKGRIQGIIAKWKTRPPAEDSAQFSKFTASLDDFLRFASEIARIGREAGPQAARKWAETDANEAMRAALTQHLDRLSHLYAARSEQLYDRIDKMINQTAWFMSLLTLAAVLLALAGAFVLRRAITKPLATITRVTEEVAAGESKIEVPYASRGDEIGALARSIVVFQEAIARNRELNRKITEEAEGRGRRNEYVSAEIASFAAGITATIGELGRLSEQMLVASKQLTGAAERASERTGGATTASAEASANVRDISSAAEELAASVAEIDRQVVLSTQITAKAIRDTERTNAVVAELNEAAGHIGDVVRLITDIAEQTNLLALNATIEAARAGDAGRGFAVVASEVKALAEQTAKATGDIGAQIAAIQNATRASIEAIRAIGRTMRDVDEISGAIATAVTEQGAATQEIARSVETAAKRTGDTAAEIGSVGESMQATRENANAVGSVADELGRAADGIRAQVEAFCQKLRAA